MPVKSNINKFIKLLESRLSGGILEAVARHADIHREQVTESQTRPPGTHKRRGQIDRGQVVERSAPGEYPYVDSGEGAESIAFGLDPKNKLSAGSGVTESGMHLVHLSHGHHWISGEDFNRLGLDHTLLRFKDEIITSFKQGFHKP